MKIGNYTFYPQLGICNAVTLLKNVWKWAASSRFVQCVHLHKPVSHNFMYFSDFMLLLLPCILKCCISILWVLSVDAFFNNAFCVWMCIAHFDVLKGTKPGSEKIWYIIDIYPLNIEHGKGFLKSSWSLFQLQIRLKS